MNWVWFSRTGDYDNFSEGVLDSDAFSLIIPTTSDVRWIDTLAAILIGTAAEEYSISSSKIDTPITPTNFAIKKQSTYGSNTAQPTRVNDVILFVDFVGRKIRELVYREYPDQKYVAPDLTSLSEHITLSGIINIAHQKNPDSILWCVLKDGSLISMTYQRDQNVIGWSKHPVNGLVNSVCVIPSETEDEIWITVTRYINGQDVVYIERFAPRIFGNELENAFFVDSGITFESDTATATITGLDHLEGQTVKVLGDGVVLDDAVVSGGKITASAAVYKAQVGLAYKYKLEPMRPDVSTQMGTTAASIKAIMEMGISFLDTACAKYGTSDDNLFDIDLWDVRWKNTSEISGLFTGTLTVTIDGGFSLDAPLIISSDSPLPCTVRAIIPRMEKTGR